MGGEFIERERHVPTGGEPSPTLIVGAVDDPAERQADEVAAQVMVDLAARSTLPVSGAAAPLGASPRVRRSALSRRKGAIVQRRTVQGADDAQVIRRVFRPTTVTARAHLRNDGQWGTHVGNRIDRGSEIIADRAVVRNQVTNRLIGSPKTTRWVKAVNATVDTYDPAVHRNAVTFIREARLGPDKDYGADGLRVNQADHKPPNRAAVQNMRLKWLEDVGEYVEIEGSVSHDDAFIVHHRNTYRRLRNGQLEDLDQKERLQLDTAATRVYFRDQVSAILRQETAGEHWSVLLATDDNVEKIIARRDAAKALRIDEFENSARERYVNWFRWADDPAGPLERIRRGANEVNASLQHWRAQLYPPDPQQATVTSLALTGSDLHEFGLGAMFVTFDKPAGGHPDYAAAGAHRVVIKPEQRGLERALFGTQAGSLANQVNAAVGLAGADQITTYKQDVHARFGTLCERVVGTQAKDIQAPQRQVTQAMLEALVFVMMTGLSDQHGENVLWHNGRPYMIDADNALKLKYMTTDPNTTSMQSGFAAMSGDNTDPVMRGVMSNARPYETQILDALRNPQSDATRQLLQRAEAAFTGQTGRTVPIETAVWGTRLQVFIGCGNDGHAADVPLPGPDQNTRWQYCNKWAQSVTNGGGANAPGLLGEVGVAHGTNGNFQPLVEAAQIFADFKVGQIPFYNYRYADGKILHNGQEIWDGQPIAERMAGLFALFPNQVRQ